MVDLTPRAWAGLPADPFDAESFRSRLSGMNGRPFTHVSVVEAGPGRRHCLGHHTSLEAAVYFLKRSTAATYAASVGQDLWIEEFPGV